MALDTLQVWHKKPISMRLRQDTLDLLDALIGQPSGSLYGGTIRDRTQAVELAVVAFAAAKKVKPAGLKKPAARRR